MQIASLLWYYIARVPAGEMNCEMTAVKRENYLLISTFTFDTELFFKHTNKSKIKRSKEFFYTHIV
jgi:hypothetical protein